MRRRLAMLLSATLVAGAAAILVPASPASAGVHVCAGTGIAVLTTGLTYPATTVAAVPPAVPLPPNPHPVHVTVTHQARTTGFSFGFGPAGACVNSNPTPPGPGNVKFSVNADGLVSGWCGLSSGTGTLRLGNNPRFAWVGIGGTLILTGGVTGVVAAVPDTLAGHSCNSHAGASQFTVVGDVVANDHCTVKSKSLIPINNTGTLQTTLISGPTGTPLVAVSTHATGTWHVWTKACVPILPLP